MISDEDMWAALSIKWERGKQLYCRECKHWHHFTSTLDATRPGVWEMLKNEHLIEIISGEIRVSDF